MKWMKEVRAAKREARRLVGLIEEYEDEIVKEMYERLIDVITANGSGKMRDCLKQAKPMIATENDEIEVEHSFTFIVNDMIQIASRIKRTGGNDAKTTDC